MSNFGDLIAEGVTTIRAEAGVTITYSRGVDSVAITATPGKQIFRLDDSDGGSVRVASRDYHFDADDLILDSAQTVPHKGDEIRQDINGTTYVFRVFRPDGGDDVYRYMDGDRNLIRVHTVERGTE